MLSFCFSRQELAEAQRTNKPSGKCQFYLMISKTCKPAKKVISGHGQTKDELVFVNDEEEFFYEVISFNISFLVTASYSRKKMSVMFVQNRYWSTFVVGGKTNDSTSTHVLSFTASHPEVQLLRSRSGGFLCHGEMVV